MTASGAWHDTVGVRHRAEERLDARRRRGDAGRVLEHELRRVARDVRVVGCAAGEQLVGPIAVRAGQPTVLAVGTAEVAGGHHGEDHEEEPSADHGAAVADTGVSESSKHAFMLSRGGRHGPSGALASRWWGCPHRTVSDSSQRTPVIIRPHTRKATAMR